MTWDIKDYESHKILTGHWTLTMDIYTYSKGMNDLPLDDEGLIILRALILINVA